MQLVYKGKTDRNLPKYNFPKEFHVTQNQSHWANETTSKELFEKIIIPYDKKVRKCPPLSKDQAWLLIADAFKAQWTDNVKHVVSD